jgi:hypothetical protein
VNRVRKAPHSRTEILADYVWIGLLMNGRGGNPRNQITTQYFEKEIPFSWDEHPEFP